METSPKISFENTEVAFQYKSSGALKKANFIFSVVNHPFVSSVATSAVKMALKVGLPIRPLIKKTAFEHFCGGESIESSKKVVDDLAKFNVCTILDYSVEGEDNEIDFDKTVAETLRTIDNAKNSSSIPFAVFKTTGLASFQLLEKVNAKKELSDAEREAYERVRKRVYTICKKGYDARVPVLIDAEETWIQNPIDEIAYEMMALFNREGCYVYNTYQMYRADSLQNLRNAFHNAAMGGYNVGAKLVRGAYMEKERERAKAIGYPSPIFETKEGTDGAFNDALIFCIENKQRIFVMCGSHNEYSNHLLTILMDKHSMRNDDQRAWFAQLYGMSDHISFNLAKAGYRVAKYVPYGPVESVMPYLLRRAEENTSVAGQSSRELTLIRKEINRRKL